MDILVVEDEKVLGKALQRGLQEAGHQCAWTHNGADGLLAAQQQSFDAIVLDLMLPDAHGLSILATLRGAGDATHFDPEALLVVRPDCAISDRLESETPADRNCSTAR